MMTVMNHLSALTATLLLLLLLVAATAEIVCDAPVPAYVPIEDEGAKLEAVVSVSRHGDRASLNILPHEHEEAGVEWICGKPAFLNSIPAGGATGGDGPIGSYGEFKQNYVAPPGVYGQRTWKGTCAAGQLTAKGSQQCYNMGKAFRSIYIDKLKLLPDEYDPEKLFVQSTDTSSRRTQQSLMSMMFGFYPPQKRNGKVVVMHSNAASVEIFKPNPTACPRVGELERAVRSSPEYMERRAAVEDILYELNSIEGTHGITPWESDVIEAWGDSLLTRMCNGMPFPCNSSGHCVASERARAVIDFYNYDSSKYLAAPEAGKLSGGYLMRYIYNRFAARAFNSTGPLYTHISAHDSTLTTALSALRYDMDGLPPYASTIVFELWKTSAGLHAVRALYNTVPIAPPECAANSTLCPLDNYRRMIENRLTVEDYDSECAVKGQ